MKENTDQAVAETSTIDHVLVVRRTETEVPWTEGRDVWWHEALAAQPVRKLPRRQFSSAQHQQAGRDRGARRQL